MKRINLIITLVILFGSCKNPLVKKESVDLVLHIENSNHDQFVKENDSPFINSVQIIDSFSIDSMNFLTINVDKKFCVNEESYSSGSYLVLLNSISDSIAFLERIKSIYQIQSDYMNRQFFTNLSDNLLINKSSTIRYSFPEEGPADFSKNILLLLQNGEIKEFLSFEQFDFFHNSLNIERKNDSICQIKYIYRDKFGYFHPDYQILINTSTISAKKFTPDAQKTYFQQPLLNTLTIFMTPCEAINYNALSDSIMVKKGEYVKIDSIFWKKEILKVITRDNKQGYVNMKEIGKTIDIDRAG